MTSPEAEDGQVSTGASVAVVFNAEIDPATLNETSFTLEDSDGTAVAGTVTAGTSGGMLTPASPLVPATRFTAKVSTAVTDAAGRALPTELSWSFETTAARDETAPEVVIVTPAGGFIDATGDVVVSVFFDEPIDPSTLTPAGFVLENADGAPVSGTVLAGSMGGWLSPDSLLRCGAEYTARVSTAVTDLAGNPLDAETSWSFVTQCEIEPCPGDSAFLDGACWFQGDWGQSCDEVCSSHALRYDPATATFTGCESRGVFCAEVMAALPDPSDPAGCGFERSPLYGGGPLYSNGAGCVATRETCQEIGAQILRSFCDSSAEVTSTAADSRMARACACR